MNNNESNQSNRNNGRWTKNHSHLTGAKLARIIGWVIVGVILACFLALIFGLLVKWLWGITLTPLFGLAQPTYWQAVALIILAKLLFGTVGHPHKDSDHSLRHGKWHERFKGGFGEAHSSSDPANSHKEQGNHYREFWENGGKKAFEEYLKRRRP